MSEFGISGLPVSTKVRRLLGGLTIALSGGLLGALLGILVTGVPMTWPLNPQAVRLLIGIPLATVLAAIVEFLLSSR
jgi:hypothetical protein